MNSISIVSRVDDFTAIKEIKEVATKAEAVETISLIAKAVAAAIDGDYLTSAPDSLCKTVLDADGGLFAFIGPHKELLK